MKPASIKVRRVYLTPDGYLDPLHNDEARRNVSSGTKYPAVLGNLIVSFTSAGRGSDYEPTRD